MSLNNKRKLPWRSDSGALLSKEEESPSSDAGEDLDDSEEEDTDGLEELLETSSELLKQNKTLLEQVTRLCRLLEQSSLSSIPSKELQIPPESATGSR